MQRFNRRHLLKLISGAGLTLGGAGLTFGSPSDRVVSTSEAKPPYFLFFHANGGWDPTLLCDPKGRQSSQEKAPINPYKASSIERVGNLKYAPSESNAAFFEKYGSRLLVINGLDVGTINHTVGTTHQWSGTRVAGHPSLGALISATEAPNSPLSHLAFGGLQYTAGTVPISRFGNLNVLAEIAWPYEVTHGTSDERFHSKGTAERLADAFNHRQALLAKERLMPRERRNLEQLGSVRNQEMTLRQLDNFLSVEPVSSPLERQVQLAVAAFRGGLCKTANLATSGFDTHANHDAIHPSQLTRLLSGIDYAHQEAERLGIADDIVYVIGSDMGRSPIYNDVGGKDHGAVGSMMMMGRGIVGNRVIGVTDERLGAVPVDAATLTTPSTDGLVLQPHHIHTALRRLAGIDTSELSLRFPLPPSALPIVQPTGS